MQTELMFRKVREAFGQKKEVTDVGGCSSSGEHHPSSSPPSGGPLEIQDFATLLRVLRTALPRRFARGLQHASQPLARAVRAYCEVLQLQREIGPATSTVGVGAAEPPVASTVTCARKRERREGRSE